MCIRDSHNTLATTQSAIATGNIAIDCILTAKLDYAEKHGIKTEYSIMAVSYTHLDVYKRQLHNELGAFQPVQLLLELFNRCRVIGACLLYTSRCV